MLTAYQPRKDTTAKVPKARNCGRRAMVEVLLGQTSCIRPIRIKLRPWTRDPEPATIRDSV